jgi:hypothetical protein
MFTAVLMALLVTVAPVTPSILVVCFSTISAGMRYNLTAF